MGKTLLRHLLYLAVSAVTLIGVWGCTPHASKPNIENDSSYFGREANEAEFNFESYIYIATKNGAAPTEQNLNEEVRLAARFMLGAMHKDASVYGAFKTKMLSSELVSLNTYKVTYRFDGKGMFNNYKSNYTLIVPIVPRALITVAANKCHNLNDAMDDGNFWYVWKPEKKDCPLIEGVHFKKIRVELSIVGQTRQSYPEYDRLVVNGQLTGTVFFGADHNNTDWNPMTGSHKDPGANSYRRMRDYLVKKGEYTARQMSAEEIMQFYNPKDKSKLPFAEEISKATPRGTIRYRFFYLETQYIEEGSEAFHYILKNTLGTDSVIFYEGHSGIGRNLNLARIENRHEFKFSINPNYQIMLLGSCIPYAYYVDMLFQRKSTEADPKGTKNLDLFAYGRESYFSSSEDLNVLWAFDTYMMTGEKISYQRIITEHPTSYFGVIGDEDNPNSY